MCTINMTFDVPETRHINIEALKKQMHSYLEFILSMPSLDMTEQAEGKKYDMSVFDSLSNDWDIDASDIREARRFPDVFVTFRTILCNVVVANIAFMPQNNTFLVCKFGNFKNNSYICAQITKRIGSLILNTIINKIIQCHK